MMGPRATQRVKYKDEIQLTKLSFELIGEMNRKGKINLINASSYSIDVIAIPLSSKTRLEDDILHSIFRNINEKLRKS